MNHGDTDEYRRCKISHQPPATLCSFRESWWGNTLKNSSPLCKSSLCSSPFLLLPEQLPSWKLSLFLLLIWIFPRLLLKVSPLFLQSCGLCVSFSSCCQHPPPSIVFVVLFMCLQANPLSWQQPWIPLSARSLHLAARHCHLQRAALTVTALREMGNGKVWLLKEWQLHRFWRFLLWIKNNFSHIFLNPLLIQGKKRVCLLQCSNSAW